MNLETPIESTNQATYVDTFDQQQYAFSDRVSDNRIASQSYDGFFSESYGVVEKYYQAFEQEFGQRLARTGLVASPQTPSTSTGSLNLSLALQAVQILQSNADSADKFQALSSIGVRAAEANQWISSSQAQDLGGIINIVNAIRNWDDMTTSQQVGSIINGWGTVTNIASDFGIDLGLDLGLKVGSNASAQSGAALANAGAAASAFAGVASVVMGIDQASDVIDAVQDMPRSQAVGAGAQNLAITGASIGAGIATTAGAVAALTTTGATLGSSVPVVGTVVGAAVGAMIGVGVGMTGSGKNTGQKLRDSWRDAMESMGIAQKMEGSHHVQLADGSTYDIGRDGGHQLDNLTTNIDGQSQRYTFDVDWSNPVATAAVPEAHVFAIATGLDPTDTNMHGLFDRAVAQSLNAASSNASSVEEVRNNFRAMLQGADPRDIASRVELLRATQKISNQEYEVYLKHINLVFGTRLQPSDANKALEFFVQQLTQVPPSELDGQSRALLEQLIVPEKRAEAEAKLAERIGEAVGSTGANAAPRPPQEQ